MGIIVQQTIRNSFATYLGIAIGMLSTIILFPNILGAEKYGLTRTLIAISTISGQLISFGLPSAILKYLPSENNSVEEKSIFFLKLIRPVGILLIIYTALFFSFQDRWLKMYDDPSLLSGFFWLVIPLLISTISFTLLSTYVRTFYDTVFATILQEVCLRVLIITWLFLFYFSKIDFFQFMNLFISSYIINFLILFIYSLKRKFFIFNSNISSTILPNKEVYTYSLFVFMSGFTMIVVSNIDLVMVDIFEGLEVAGVYALSMYIGTVISVPRKSMTKIIHPILSKAFSENNMKHIEKVYKQSSTNQLFFSLLIFIGIITNLQDLFIFLPVEFHAGKNVIIILGFAYLFDLANGANSQIIITSKYYKFDFITSILLLIFAVLLNYLLIPKFGINGAALSTAISIFSFNSIRTIFVWFVLRIQPFKWHTLSIIVLGIVCFYLGEFLNIGEHPILSITIRSVIIGTTYLGIAYMFRLSDEFNTTIEELVVKLKSNN